MTTTCQICARAFKTVRARSGADVMAHHGFKRRGGWQTSSCFGARWRPFEVACDAIPAAIKRIDQFVEQQSAALDRLTTTPPDVLTYVKGSYNTQTFTVDKPADFNPATVTSANR